MFLKSYYLAYDMARTKLRDAGDEQVRRRIQMCGCEYLDGKEAKAKLCSLGARPDEGGIDGGAAVLRYLGRECLVGLPGGEVWTRGDGADGGAVEAPIWLKIVLLHYLNDSTAAGLTGDLVPFRDLPGGALYQGNFYQRTVRRLIKRFGDDPGAFVSEAILFGGREVSYGDAGAELFALPRVPIVFALWRADEEFGPDAQVLFDSSAPSYLPTEDVVVLCQEVVGELIRGRRGALG